MFKIRSIALLLLAALGLLFTASAQPSGYGDSGYSTTSSQLTYPPNDWLTPWNGYYTSYYYPGSYYRYYYPYTYYYPYNYYYPYSYYYPYVNYPYYSYPGSYYRYWYWWW